MGALRPLRSFAAQVEHIQPGNLAEQKVSEDVLPEFQRFSRSFNGMIDRLDAGFAAQRQFTGNAAHELRTPTTVILAACEDARKNAQTPADYQAALDVIDRQAQRRPCR